MKLLNFIICDDIRTELGRKNSLMGVYDDVLNFLVTTKTEGRWPKAIKLSFYVRFVIESLEEKSYFESFKIFMSFSGENKEIVKGAISKEKLVELITENSLKMVVNNYVASFSSAGEATFRIVFFKQDKEIFSITPESRLRITERDEKEFMQTI